MVRSCYSAPARWYTNGPVGRILFYEVPFENGFFTGENTFWPYSQDKDIINVDGTGELTTEPRKYYKGNAPCPDVGEPVGTAEEFAGRAQTPWEPPYPTPAHVIPTCTCTGIEPLPFIMPMVLDMHLLGPSRQATGSMRMDCFMVAVAGESLCLEDASLIGGEPIPNIWAELALQATTEGNPLTVYDGQASLALEDAATFPETMLPGFAVLTLAHPEAIYATIYGPSELALEVVEYEDDDSATLALEGGSIYSLYSLYSLYGVGIALQVYSLYGLPPTPPDDCWADLDFDSDESEEFIIDYPDNTHIEDGVCKVYWNGGFGLYFSIRANVDVNEDDYRIAFRLWLVDYPETFHINVVANGGFGSVACRGRLYGSGLMRILIHETWTDGPTATLPTEEWIDVELKKVGSTLTFTVGSESFSATLPAGQDLLSFLLESQISTTSEFWIDAFKVCPL